MIHNKIQIAFLFCEIIRNVIPPVLCFAETGEIRRNGLRLVFFNISLNKLFYKKWKPPLLEYAWRHGIRLKIHNSRLEASGLQTMNSNQEYRLIVNESLRTDIQGSIYWCENYSPPPHLKLTFPPPTISKYVPLMHFFCYYFSPFNLFYTSIFP